MMTRLFVFSRLYLIGGAVLVTLVLYLAVVAQVTAVNYKVDQLRQQQQELQAQAADLRYQEASLQSPANVDQLAQQDGMQRQGATKFVDGSAVAVDLSQGIDSGVAEDETPMWQRALAIVMGFAPGGEAMASTNGH